jgi:cytochrome P450
MPSDLADFHPFDPAILESPWEFNRRLRAQAPVYRDPHTGLFLVSSFDLVLEVIKDHETYSSRFAPAMGGQGLASDPRIAELQSRSYPIVDTMLTADPPEHRRFRGLVNKAFTLRRVEGLASGLEKLADELIDAFVEAGECELLSQFAVLLPLTVIADQLGVPRSDLARFKRWSDGFTAQLSGMAAGEEMIDAIERILEYQQYFAEKLDEARERPRDDIISDLVRARFEDERPLDTGESLSILQQLLVAGNETTAATLAEGVLLLIQNPDQMALVRDDPSLIPTMVEETLRLTTPTANMWRRVKRDTELDGVEIPADSMLMVRYASANRDETRFRDPDRFDVRRENADEHIAFGHGIHFCLGAALARKELAVGFRHLLDRLDDLALAPGFEPRHKPSVLLRGLGALDITFTPRAA